MLVGDAAAGPALGRPGTPSKGARRSQDEMVAGCQERGLFEVVWDRGSVARLDAVRSIEFLGKNASTKQYLDGILLAITAGTSRTTPYCVVQWSDIQGATRI